jgi:hypothetical protein
MTDEEIDDTVALYERTYGLLSSAIRTRGIPAVGRGMGV